ncbi:response regulator receiver protein [Thalassoporum mexicanum PCC 7367]|uniref:response regulator n=1 Tax=Thalassoporum mexicanum TaxID=3457544 RepID=UPI00029FF572|nr:response regulator [Pseudanabaena sp. PCC 7367]AFY69462.1 response regulator receiver protein [Pseudanabaena sp. PCC 7367]
MQGTLKEIDVTSILRLIELGQRTGELLIESNTGRSWFVFFVNGEITYATDPTSNLNRLRDYLHGLNLDSALEQVLTAKLGINVIEYGQIWALLESQVLSPKQAKAIIRAMIVEVLFDILSLHEGNFVFELGASLAPQLTTIKLSPLLKQITIELQAWYRFYPYIQSPDQCPAIAIDGALPKLNQWVNGKTSLRQLARYGNQSIFAIAKNMYTGILSGAVAMAPLALPVTTKPRHEALRIICIDDSVTICRAVEYILHNNGYQVTAISNPIKALSLVFQLKPDLILCDIAMPDLDGYELCGMFRKSSYFARKPIIMLTGKDGFIDRVKARMVGATEYLTKPFGEKELLMMVEKYLANSHINSEGIAAFESYHENDGSNLDILGISSS